MPTEETFSHSAEEFIREYFGSEFWSKFSGGSKQPALKNDLYETADQLIALVELPGLSSPDDVQIAIDGSNLKLKGHTSGYTINNAHCHQNGFSEGPFQKQIKLPAPVEPDSIVAQYRGGILEMSMTKKDINDTAINITFE